MNTPAALREGRCPGALAPMQAGDGLLARLRVSGKPLSLDRAEAIADCAARFGNGMIELSSRANLQLRGVCEANLPALRRRLSDLDLIDADVADEAVRNIVASPIADIDPAAIVDVLPIVAALEAQLAANPLLRRLPAKFGFLIDGAGALPLGAVEADVRFEAFRGEDGPRFAVTLAGGDDATAACALSEVAEVAASLAAAFLREAAARGDAPRRMRELTLAHGAAPMLRAAGLTPEPPRPRERRAPAHQDILGIHALLLSAFGQSQPSPQPLSRRRERGLSVLPSAIAKRSSDAGEGGPTKSGRMRADLDSALSQYGLGDFFFVGAAPALGRMAADDFRFLAQAARRCSGADIRVTPWRALIVSGLERRGAEDLAAALAPRFIVDPADPRLAVVACSGAPACAKAVRPVQAEALALASALSSGVGITLHVSGCTKGCAHPRAAPFTLVARPSGYDLVVNGAVGDEPLRVALPPSEIAPLLARLQGRSAP